MASKDILNELIIVGSNRKYSYVASFLIGLAITLVLYFSDVESKAFFLQFQSGELGNITVIVLAIVAVISGVVMILDNYILYFDTEFRSLLASLIYKLSDLFIGSFAIVCGFYLVFLLTEYNIKEAAGIGFIVLYASVVLTVSAILVDWFVYFIEEYYWEGKAY